MECLGMFEADSVAEGLVKELEDRRIMRQGDGQ